MNISLSRLIVVAITENWGKALEEAVLFYLVHTHTHTHARTHARTHAHTHTHTHTHTHPYQPYVSLIKLNSYIKCAVLKNKKIKINDFFFKIHFLS